MSKLAEESPSFVTYLSGFALQQVLSNMSEVDVCHFLNGQ